LAQISPATGIGVSQETYAIAKAVALGWQARDRKSLA
jgi:hypothetical protein